MTYTPGAPEYSELGKACTTLCGGAADEAGVSGYGDVATGELLVDSGGLDGVRDGSAAGALWMFNVGVGGVMNEPLDGVVGFPTAATANPIFTPLTGRRTGKSPNESTEG